MDLNSCCDCDGGAQNNPNSVDDFDFSRFSSYLLLLNEIERQSRLVMRRRGNLHKSLELNYYTDEVLSLELESIYGKMDTSSPLYPKIFQNYKEIRLEDISNWIESEMELIDELLSSSVPLIDKNYNLDEEEIITLEDYFSEEELTAFRQVHLGKIQIERFKLPRILDKTELFTKDNLNKIVINETLSNFDPHLNLSSLPNIPVNFLQNDLIETYPPETICSSIQTLAHENVTGVNLANFLSIYKNEKGYELVSSEYGFSSFREMCSNISHVIWMQDYLIFPTYLEGLICCPQNILAKIRHKLLFILGLNNGICRVSEIVAHFKEIFKFDLGCERVLGWDLTSCSFLNFFSFIFNINERDPANRWNVLIHHENELPEKFYKTIKNSNKSGEKENLDEKYFLVRVGKEVLKIIENHNSKMIKLKFEKLKAAEIERAQSKSSFSQKVQNAQPQVAQFLIENSDLEVKKLTNKKISAKTNNYYSHSLVKNFKIDVDEIMKKGEAMDDYFKVHLKFSRSRKVPCIVSHYESPINFHVCVYDNWDSLNKFQAHITERYKNLLNDNLDLVVSPSDLEPNFNVAVLHFLDESEEDFCRGVYLQKDKNGLHKVLIVDYGDTVLVKGSEIFYLLKEVAYEKSQQAIFCRLSNIIDIDDIPDEISDACWDLFKDKKVDIKFMEQAQLSKKWLVIATIFNQHKKQVDVGEIISKKLDGLKTSSNKGQYITSSSSKPQGSSKISNELKSKYCIPTVAGPITKDKAFFPTLSESIVVFQSTESKRREPVEKKSWSKVAGRKK